MVQIVFNFDVILDSNTGIEIVNELGDVNVKAKEMSIESEDSITFKIEKEISIEAESIELNAGKNIEITAPNDVNFNASQINIKGNGVLAGNKPIALDKDQVVGVDKHDIEVPTPKGPQTVPMIPHPYIGILSDKQIGRAHV